MDEHSIEHWRRIEQHLNQSVAALVHHMDEHDVLDVQDYLNAGEYGLACELLMHCAKQVNQCKPTSLIEAAHRLGLI